MSESGECPKPEEILDWWVRSHQTLDDDQRASFLRKSEITELSALPSWAVQSAVRLHKKLSIIKVEAKKMSNLGPTGGSSPTPLTDAEWRTPLTSMPGPSAKQSPQEEAAFKDWLRRKQRQESSPAPGGEGEGDTTGGSSMPGGSGTPGTRATYQSGLANNPGAPEPAIGDRCSSCSAFIPSGSLHECWNG